MTDDSYKIIFLDINNIIGEKNVELKNDDELKPEIKEKFEISSSIIDNFIENHILVDVEKEENYIYHLTSFIYKIDKNKIKTYKFYLYRQIDENINIEFNAFLILINLEKELPIELLNKIMAIITHKEIFNLKISILGYYKSNDSKITTSEYIDQLINEKNADIDYKYLEVDLNKQDLKEVNEITNFIEELVKEIYEDNNGTGRKKREKGENNAASNCILI